MLALAGAENVVGVELSDEAVAYSQKHYSAPNLTFIAANAENLSFLNDRAVDVVVSFETIEHLFNAEAYLDEIVRILRPGGRFLVSTPDRRIASIMYFYTQRPANTHHVREYTEGELLDLLSSKFIIESCYGQGFVSRKLVFWPVQFLIKSFCRLIGTSKLQDFKDKLYSNDGNVEVVERKSNHKIPKFWLISCCKPASTA